MAENSQPRGRGPPKKVYRSCGRHAAIQQTLSIFSADNKTSSPQSIDILPTPPLPVLAAAAVVVPPLSSEERLITSIAITRPSIQCVLQCSQDGSAHLLLFLDSITHLGPIWQNLGTIPTMELPFWFDSQMNDYNMHKLYKTESIEMVWFGHPGDSPNDFRACHLLIRWREGLVPTSTCSLQAVKGKVVLQSLYYCRGVCSLGDDLQEKHSGEVLESIANMRWKKRWKEHLADRSAMVVVNLLHLVPGSALLSANIKTVTLHDYFVKTKLKVLHHACEIVSIAHQNPQDQKKILECVYHALEDNLWLILKWMIDKCRFLLNAIKQFCKNVIIIICQFHIIQALVELNGEDGHITGGPKIPNGMKQEYVVYFHDSQCCHTHEEWPLYEARFFQWLEHLCMFSDVEDAKEESEDSGSERELPASSQLPSPQV
ncbi:hypothetical protein M422DRAFT_263821 [Sphaerobolus stellatus SS14]|uniref:Unplaced genomic scaffold SPHSTscaffold_128, whole genome shotgun sequence n=1 Tax=Sphaerobolus stellatus (strain SS14) TaxID=990650 RepID=A0A0C9V9L1_SPHS4|nr:hypothetical protein M422DRAFT_263821 [Sphaerobolus stellatus SS14]